MIVHKDFESDCNRIAKGIMNNLNTASKNMLDVIIDKGCVEVIVSGKLISAFNANKYKDVPKWEKEINKHLKRCSVKFKTLGYGHGWFIVFDLIEE